MAINGTQRAHVWKPGQSGNPNGRPKGTRNRLAENLIADFAAEWERSGKAIIAKLATDDPAKFAELASKLVPREFLISVAPKLPGNLEPDEWSDVLEIMRGIREALPGDQRAPGDVIAYVLEAVRSFAATPVDSGNSSELLQITYVPQTRGHEG